MLKAKFDGDFENTPATYIWSRLVRMKSARGGAAQKEMAGHLEGGYKTLAISLGASIQSAGGSIFLNTPIDEVIVEHGCLSGLRVQGQKKDYDAVVATIPLPLFQRILPANTSPAYQELLGRTRYMGVICPVMAVDRPLTGYWTLNIADDQVPFTGVIETTAYIDPRFVGGYHLVYLPKYTSPEGEWYQMSDEDIQRIWIETLQIMFPEFDPASIKHFRVNRERYVEPVHPLNGEGLIPEIQTPIKNLFLATTAQIYPALTNVESVTRYASKTVELINAKVNLKPA
jgi:protoporphyrinogen oxidase